ncbi:MAG: transglutaminase-like domain-containing protein [Pirellulales bacterium]
MKTAACLFVFTSALMLPQAANAQLKQDAPDSSALKYGEPVVGKFRVGAEIKAGKGACRDVRAMIAVPFECAEQEVRILDEDISTEVDRVEYRELPGGGAKQMLITIPFLADGATARAVVTFEVATRPILPTEQTGELKIPDRLDNDMRRFVLPSPFIEAKHSEIRRLGREVLKGLEEDATDWQKIEALYDHVQEHIAYVEGDDKSALDTLRDKNADCHGRSALFIALCRSMKTPARMVWVHNHAYAEFYMEDAEGNGTWFPAESAGTRAFGEMPLARTILQKGDNFRVPERPGDRLRYATDYLMALPVGKAGKPTVQYIREQVE